MSKRAKNTVPLALNLLDLPQETLKTIAKDGSTRRRLSRTNKNINKTLKFVSKEQQVFDLKNAFLEYYQELQKDLEDPNQTEHIFFELVIEIEIDSTYANVQFPNDILTRRDVEGNIIEKKYESRLPPLNKLSKLVRDIIAYIFHSYYVANSTLDTSSRFVLNINMPQSSSTFISFQWSSLQNFLENNPYYILLEGLTKKYKSLSYFYDLPTFIGNQAPTYTEEQYENSFADYERNVVLTEQTEVTEFQEVIVTSIKLKTEFDVFANQPPLECKSLFYTMEQQYVFMIECNLWSDELNLFKDFLEYRTLFVKKIVEFIQILLPKCLQSLFITALSNIMVYVLLRDVDTRLPFYFMTDKSSIYSQNMYDDAKNLLLNWMNEFPSILKENQFRFITIDENMRVEIHKNDYDVRDLFERKDSY